MHKKEVCKKCYQFHERFWDFNDDIEWDKNGRVMCPVDNFNVMQKDGVKFEPEKPIRNLLGFVFGWHEISEEIPKWCPFKEEHI